MRSLSKMRFALTLLGVAALCAAFALFGRTRGAHAAAIAMPTTVAMDKGIDPSNLDTSCKPCDDFNRFANGGWIQKNPIPPAYPRWGSFNTLSEKNQDVLHGILEDAAKSHAPKGSNEQKIGDFYASCMDESRIEAEGAKPIQPELARIEKIDTVRELPAEVAHLQKIGARPFFGFFARQDFKNSKDVIGSFNQGGLSLPDRDYYLNDDARSKTIRDEYVKHVAKMFELLGDDVQKAHAEAQAVMNIETALAKASLTRIELRVPEASYHKMTVAELQKIAPNFDWNAYLKDMGEGSLVEVNVGQPKFFEAFSEELKSAPLGDIKTYLRWRVLETTASGLSSKFVEEDFNFSGRVLQGTKEQLPRWKRCVRATDAALGEALGQVYVQKTFTPEAKARALAMVNNLIAALRSDISTLSWMSDATRKEATAKLEAFAKKIGYPDKWRDYSSLNITRGDLIGDRFRVATFSVNYNLNKIGKPVDRTEWGMSPPTVNAYYNPAMNEIVFPAGILQPPFFDPNADDAVNYGGIGAVIGHEMTHGFDDSGAKFDAEGNLRNWFTPEDLKNFQSRAECIQKQFDGYVVDGDVHEKGKLVSGESIADLGGLTIAYAAFEKSLEGKPRPAPIDGFTPEQRFFLAWAQIWAENVRPEYARLQATTDPHPLGKWRVDGPLSNMPQFAQAFGCKAGDPMVRPESERCQIW